MRDQGGRQTDHPYGSDPAFLSDHLSGDDLWSFPNPESLMQCRDRFARFGYIKLASFLKGQALAIFQSEMARMEERAVRRGFEMPGYATPRRLSVLGGAALRAVAPSLVSMYHHHAIRGCVEAIAGRPIYSCRHPEEFMVANFLKAAGDTHGWHLDDPSLALVIFAAAPEPGAGGEAEVIVNWTDLCRRRSRAPDQDIEDLLAWAFGNDLVDRHSHDAGDAYLLRADINLHRVGPLTSDTARRWVLNLAFETTRTPRYGSTASLLYGAPQPDAAVA